MKKNRNKIVTDYNLGDYNALAVQTNDSQWVEVASKDFFDHLTQVKKDQGEVWTHDPDAQALMIAQVEDHYDFERGESYTIPGRGQIYTYEQFFRSHSLELIDLFTAYVQSLVVQSERVEA